MNYNINDYDIPYLNYCLTTAEDKYECFKRIFTVKEQYEMLGIKRNRYYYLVRSNQLNNEIQKLFNYYKDNHWY